MKKTKFRDLRLAYKISLISAVLFIVLILVQVFFVLLPLYSAVGDLDEQSPEKTKNVETAQTYTDITYVAFYILPIVSVVTASYGAYKDARNKSKK